MTESSKSQSGFLLFFLVVLGSSLEPTRFPSNVKTGPVRVDPRKYVQLVSRQRDDDKSRTISLVEWTAAHPDTVHSEEYYRLAAYNENDTDDLAGFESCSFDPLRRVLFAHVRDHGVNYEVLGWPDPRRPIRLFQLENSATNPNEILSSKEVHDVDPDFMSMLDQGLRTKRAVPTDIHDVIPLSTRTDVLTENGLDEGAWLAKRVVPYRFGRDSTSICALKSYVLYKDELLRTLWFLEQSTIRLNNLFVNLGALFWDIDPLVPVWANRTMVGVFIDAACTNVTSDELVLRPWRSAENPFLTLACGFVSEADVAHVVTAGIARSVAAVEKYWIGITRPTDGTWEEETLLDTTVAALMNDTLPQRVDRIDVDVLKVDIDGIDGDVALELIRHAISPKLLFIEIDKVPLPPPFATKYSISWVLNAFAPLGYKLFRYSTQNALLARQDVLDVLRNATNAEGCDEFAAFRRACLVPRSDEWYIPLLQRAFFAGGPAENDREEMERMVQWMFTEWHQATSSLDDIEVTVVKPS